MAVYRLTCSCGHAHKIETSAAGRTIECPCGKQLVIPSMRQIRALPLWQELPEENRTASNTSDVAADPQSKPEPPTEKTPVDGNGSRSGKGGTAVPKSGGVLRGNRKGFLIVGLVLIGVFSVLLLHSLHHKPRPQEVLRKQRAFLLGDTVVQRDSLPITMEDFRFYVDIIDEESLPFYQVINAVEVTSENLKAAQKINPEIKLGDHILPVSIELGQWVEVNDWLIDRMAPTMAYRYLDHLKNGPRLSDNFYENLDMLGTQYKFKVTLYSILLALSVVLCAVPWMLPKQDYVVGTMRGSVWKA